MLTPTRTLPWLLAVCLAGCSTARKTDVLEARLRSQEDTIAVYEAEVQRVKTELASVRRESEDLRLQLADQGKAPAAESDAVFRATGVQLSSLMTGGLDTDGEPGHDALSVVLIPHDGNGELIKLPGRIEIEAIDPTRPGGAQTIGQWQFDQRDIHDYWHKGVVQSGYQFQLPWQSAPRADQVLVLAHLTTADGRRFDTNLTVKVDPPGDSSDGSPAKSLQQASASGVNPFGVRPVAGEQPTASSKAESTDKIIWADGEGPAPRADDASARQARRATSAAATMPADGLSTSPSSRRAPRPQPATGTGPSAAALRAAQRQAPPPIEDWFSDEDWATQDVNTQTGGVRTSDSFTEQTLPVYR
jgi:hypothetical protein